MSGNKKRTPNARKEAARAYAAEHGVNYTEALRAVQREPKAVPADIPLAAPGATVWASNGDVGEVTLDLFDDPNTTPVEWFIGFAGRGKTVAALRQVAASARAGRTQILFTQRDTEVLAESPRAFGLDPARISAVHVSDLFKPETITAAEQYLSTPRAQAADESLLNDIRPEAFTDLPTGHLLLVTGIGEDVCTTAVTWLTIREAMTALQGTSEAVLTIADLPCPRVETAVWDMLSGIAAQARSHRVGLRVVAIETPLLTQMLELGCRIWVGNHHRIQDVPEGISQQVRDLETGQFIILGRSQPLAVKVDDPGFVTAWDKRFSLVMPSRRVARPSGNDVAEQPAPE